jgi:hypothetical protein
VRECAATAIREEAAEHAILNRLIMLRLHPDEQRYCLEELDRLRADANKRQEEIVSGLQLQLGQIEDRLTRLTDAYIDRLIERQLFEERKAALLMERRDVDGQLTDWMGGKRNVADELAKFLERADSAYLAYKRGILPEKRQLLDSLTSNRLVDQKTPIITLAFPFEELATRFESQDGGASRDIPRTWQRLLAGLLPLIAADAPRPAQSPA